jgi:hypothetical protein
MKRRGIAAAAFIFHPAAVDPMVFGKGEFLF